MAYTIAIIEDEENIAQGIDRLVNQYGYESHLLTRFDALDEEI